MTTQEKIARSLMPREHELAASYYGKYFVRKLQLSLLHRRPEDWRTAQIKQKQDPTLAANQLFQKSSANATQERKRGRMDEQENGGPEADMPKKKKKRKDADEIDAVFDTVKDSRFSKVNSAVSLPREQPDGGMSVDGLQKVLGAIKDAPKGDGKSKKRKKA